MREIQERCPLPLWHLSLDDFLNAYARRPPESFFPVMHGYLRSLRALADEGIDIVAEAVIIPERKETYRTTFEGIPQLLVGVRCPLEVAQAREASLRQVVIEIPADRDGLENRVLEIAQGWATSAIHERSELGDLGSEL